MLKKYLICLSLAVAALVQGCAKPVETEHEAVYYKELGDEYFTEGSYKKAVQSYESALVRAESPEMASQIQLSLANAFFLGGDYFEAIPVYEVYLDYYGNTPESDMAILRIGLAHFNLIQRPSRDQTETETALKYFRQLQKRNPDLAKENDLDAKIVDIRKRLAEKEYIVARYYGRILMPESAMLRYKYLVTNYPESPRVEISLKRLVELLIQFNNIPDAQQYFDELKTKFPNSAYITKLEKELLKK